MKALIRPFLRDRRGAASLIAAGSMTALIAATAFAVDMGNIYVSSRKLQGVADAAALAAVDVSSTTTPTTAAQQVITRNALQNAQVATLVQGTYTPDGTIPSNQRFVAATPVPNAVRLTLSQSVPLFFGRVITGRSTTQISATATAARIDYAAFSIGTRLAALQGGLANALLSALIGTNLNLSVSDYNALVGTQINLLTFSKALGTQLNLNAASFNDTLNAKATLPQVMSALAAASGDPAGAAALQSLAVKVPPTQVQLSNLLNLGPYGSQDHADPSTAISADGYSIVRETLALANGARQVQTNLGVSLPNLASTSVNLAMGQRPEHSPWLTVASDGSVIIRTAQSRLYFNTQVGTPALGLAVRVPVYTELAAAQAKLASISCLKVPGAPQGQPSTSVGLTVLPSVGSISVADINTPGLDNFSKPITEGPASIASGSVPLLGIPLVNVSAQVHTDVGGVNTNWQPVNFSPDDIASGTVKTVSTGDIVQGVASSVMNQMALKTTIAGVPINLAPLTSAIGALLTPLAPALDGVIDSVTGLLGVHVGQADLKIDGVRCGKPSLVA